MVGEIAKTGVVPDAIVLSVGGGGLLCGVAEGLQLNGWGQIPIIAVETHGSASFAEATKRGKQVELDAITSIATSLGAKQVCKRALQWWDQRDIKSILVSDQDSVNACHAFLDDHRLLVEPACGASLATLYQNRQELAAYHSIVAIVCGGATTTIDQLNKFSSIYVN